jgi:hypothetical protein
MDQPPLRWSDAEWEQIDREAVGLSLPADPLAACEPAAVEALANALLPAIWKQYEAAHPTAPRPPRQPPAAQRSGGAAL